MKNVMRFFCLFPLFAWAQQRPEPTGNWKGTLNAGAELHLIFTFASQPSFNVRIACPEQGFTDFPASAAAYRGDSVLVDFGSLKARYAGRRINDTTIRGEWQQGMSLPLDLHPAGGPVALDRPQTPRPPFPYKSRDVSYTSRDKKISYAGTLTEPQGAGPFPAIVLITGSAQQNRDEEILGHKTFAVLADYLTKKGFAVLRVDDRGVGGTTGDAEQATSLDFAGDVGNGLDYLKTLSEIDRNRLGLLGHSEGGLIAPMVARQRKDIRFIVLLAGPGVNGREVLNEQNAAILRSVHVPEEQVNSYIDVYNKMLGLFAARPTGHEVAGVDSLLGDWMARTPAGMVQSLTGVSDEAGRKRFAASMAEELGKPWFRYFLSYDPKPALESYTGKLLALNGSRDVQVISSRNLGAIRAIIKKHGRPAQEAVELAGLNHLFQTCSACTVNEYGQLTETIAPAALDTIGRWLEKNVPNKR